MRTSQRTRQRSRRRSGNGLATLLIVGGLLVMMIIVFVLIMLIENQTVDAQSAPGIARIISGTTTDLMNNNIDKENDVIGKPKSLNSVIGDQSPEQGRPQPRAQGGAAALEANHLEQEELKIKLKLLELERQALALGDRGLIEVADKPEQHDFSKQQHEGRLLNEMARQEPPGLEADPRMRRMHRHRMGPPGLFPGDEMEPGAERHRREEKPKPPPIDPDTVSQHLGPDAGPGDCFINDKGQRLCLPSFILLGCCHCGSNALYIYLNNHPQIKIFQKETNWFEWPHEKVFLKDEYARRLVMGRDGLPAGKITGELGTRYIGNPGAPERVKRMLPNVKLLLMLREPGEMCFTATVYANQRWFQEHVPPAQEVGAARCLPEYLPDYAEQKAKGLYRNDCELGEYYVEGLKRWLELFPREQLLVFGSEELKADGASVMRRIEDHLGLPRHEGYPFRSNFNPSHLPGRKDEMPDSLRLMFDACYEDGINEIEKILGQEFHWKPHQREYWYEKGQKTMHWSKIPDSRLYPNEA